MVPIIWYPVSWNGTHKLIPSFMKQHPVSLALPHFTSSFNLGMKQGFREIKLGAKHRVTFTDHNPYILSSQISSIAWLWTFLTRPVWLDWTCLTWLDQTFGDEVAEEEGSTSQLFLGATLLAPSSNWLDEKGWMKNVWRWTSTAPSSTECLLWLSCGWRSSTELIFLCFFSPFWGPGAHPFFHALILVPKGGGEVVGEKRFFFLGKFCHLVTEKNKN
jgi:hypothetical protein